MENWISERYEKWKTHFKNIETSYDANDFPVMFTVEESKTISISDLPLCDREICIVKGNGRFVNVHQFFGFIKKIDAGVTIFISYDFRLNDWDLPLSPIYHVDLLKRVIEWRKEKDGNITDITTGYNEHSTYLRYRFTPSVEESISLFEVFQLAKEIDDWGRNIVFELQEIVGNFHLKISEEYSISNFLNNNQLLEGVENELDSNKKGKLLEDLISRLFGSINGFEINDRVRTETEEIDILILNKSKESIWQKESPLVLIECKNWSSKCGKNELVLFKEKIKNRYGRAKIGFFISWNGFKETFDKESLRSSQDDIVVIPVTGRDIIEGMKTSDFGTVVEKWWMNMVSK
jgi:hypothetical protein